MNLPDFWSNEMEKASWNSISANFSQISGRSRSSPRSSLYMVISLSNPDLQLPSVFVLSVVVLSCSVRFPALLGCCSCWTAWVADATAVANCSTVKFAADIGVVGAVSGLVVVVAMVVDVV